MNNLVGSLSEINTIQGTLVPIQNFGGALSSVNGQLTGVLVSTNINSRLIGVLKSQSNNLNGILSVPPEVPTEIYDGEYLVIPKPFDEQTLETAGLKMKHDVTVREIPYYETSNESGYTVYIGGE